MISFNMRDLAPNTKIDWVSRYELLLRLCKDADYQMYISGCGDVIFEFPMYDFSPSDYGSVYEKLYTINFHLISDDINDEGGQPVSALQITSTFLSEELNTNPVSGNTSQDKPQLYNQLNRTIFSNVLASRIGVHLETIQVVGVTDTDKLVQLGMIEFNKRLAAMNTFDMEHLYRPFLGINRPIYHAQKERMGITTSVNDTWNIRQDATTKTSLAFTRKKENDGRWRFITGGEATPISYSTIYYDPSVIKAAGVNVTPETVGKTPKGAI